jgi:hypothetical protein
MKLGGLGDFLTLLTFGIGALALAAHQAFRLRPSMAARLPRFLESRWWFIVPVAMCVSAGGVLGVRHLQQPVVQEPGATWQPAPPPPGFSAVAAATAEPEGTSSEPEGFNADPEDMAMDPEGTADPEGTGADPADTSGEAESAREERVGQPAATEHAQGEADRTKKAAPSARATPPAASVSPPKANTARPHRTTPK